MTVKLNKPPAAPAIQTKHRMLISSIQDLALDINALGKHHVHTHLWGHTFQLDIRVTEAPYTTACQSIWAKTIYLPRNNDRCPSLSESALDDLTDTVAYLTDLLVEPEACS